MSVAIKSLREVATIKSGQTFRAAIKEIAGGNAHVIQMRDVSLERGIDFPALITTAIDKPDWLAPNDILFTPKGNNNIAIQMGEEANQIDVVATNHFMVIRVNDEALLPEFLTWWINQQPAQTYFDRQSEGSTIRNIRRGILELVPVPLPSLERQKTIVQFAETMGKKHKLFAELIENDRTVERFIATSLYKQ
ncbi:restriction endonuclease subunit S [Ignatzschineria sp. RMDPL8A]|uniref:restriction endonuclease subunit S n=1 Tax=Ignatzschineria sp. RMDPL8A TaxID=2999236 RepID=UPI0024465E28|nr:restriction endonuclease subunit S [Ignatzschineria sp. RMDPL8A]MDG9730333.1 restriction endonuclease subunit S [Ignatzschineria sp. RMDPL8A]